MANAQFAFDTAANWASNNRTPLLDEVCFESDVKRFKVGDGSTAYNSLQVFSGTAAIYGDGSDGAATISGNTSLTRDMFYTDLTVNSGITLTAAGYRIFCTGTLTNNGTISNNGAGTSTNGGGLTGPGITWGKQASTWGSGTNGGTGAGPAAPTSQSGSLGGTGGNGGSGAGGAGGLGGAITAPSVIGQTVFNAICKALPTLSNGYYAYFTSGALVAGSAISGGMGGGAGGGSGTLNGRGGGGAGGPVPIFARIITGTGAIQARGGSPDNAANANTGGGGGGGGGVVVVVSTSVLAGAVAGQTIDANGGTGAAGNGTGTAGGNGGNGTVIIVPG